MRQQGFPHDLQAHPGIEYANASALLYYKGTYNELEPFINCSHPLLLEPALTSM